MALCRMSWRQIEGSNPTIGNWRRQCRKECLKTVSTHRNRSSRRRMYLCMQDNQNGQKMMVLTSAEETRLTCFILLQNIFFWSNLPSLTADVNTIINLPWYPRKIVHFSLVLSPSRVYYDFYVSTPHQKPVILNCQSNLEGDVKNFQTMQWNSSKLIFSKLNLS